jgi:hypothetical protein
MKKVPLFQTPHSFSVTIFTLGFRLFFNPAANNKLHPENNKDL